MGLAARLCESLYHFCLYHHWFRHPDQKYDSHKCCSCWNRYKINCFSAVNNALEGCPHVYCICLAVYSCTEFSSIQCAWYFCRWFPLNNLPRTQCTNYKCAVKIYNLIKLNCLAIILQLFLALNHQTDWHKGKSLAAHA